MLPKKTYLLALLMASCSLLPVSAGEVPAKSCFTDLPNTDLLDQPCNSVEITRITDNLLGLSLTSIDTTLTFIMDDDYVVEQVLVTNFYGSLHYEAKGGCFESSPNVLSCQIFIQDGEIRTKIEL